MTQETTLPPLPPTRAGLVLQNSAGEHWEYSADDMRAYAQAALAADAAAQARGAVPDGWKLVPIEPTQEMVEAGYDAQGEAIEVALRDAWTGMIAAAPHPTGDRT